MISIRDAAAMASISDPLVQQRFSELDGDVHFVIVQVGDSVADIESECGFPILTNIVDGSQFGDDEFVPCASRWAAPLATPHPAPDEFASGAVMRACVDFR